jgi:hypothetical protein
LSAAAGLLQGAHAIIAMQRQEPHWMLNDDDAKKYGQALANAMRHLPVKVAQKYVDYSTLVMVAFVMETPRVVRSVQIARAPKTPNRGPAQVFQFVTPNNPGAASTPPPPPTATPSQSPSTASGAGEPPIAEGPPDLNAFGGEGFPQ